MGSISRDHSLVPGIGEHLRQSALESQIVFNE
jgi:hypothetical protein